MQSSAALSPCGLYRYRLSRVWEPVGPRLQWIMLNPSTADAEQDDPTIRRCIAFTKSWGYGGLDVVNVFSLRATDPSALVKAARDGVPLRGPDHFHHIRLSDVECVNAVAAWGAHKMVTPDSLLHWRHHRIKCLGLTKNGSPRHPLYVSGFTIPQEFTP